MRTSSCLENPAAGLRPLAAGGAARSALPGRLVSPAATLTLVDLGSLARWLAAAGDDPALEALLAPVERDQLSR